VAPDLSQQGTQILAAAKGRSLSIREGKGFWARDGQQLIQARKMSPDGRLVDLLVFELDADFQIEGLAHAQSAEFVDGSWQLRNLVTTRFGDQRAIVEWESLRRWDVEISPRLLKVLAIEPIDMSLRDLTLYVDYLERNGLDSNNHRLAWWSKLLAPGTNLIMLFIAMPFVFGGMRSASAGKRLFVGVLLGMAYFLINRTLGSVALVYGLPPVLSATLPPALFLVGGGIAMLRVR
jgi:lipopolysaccharide export system permease protein